MPVKLVAGPEVEPISYVEAKEQLRLDVDDEEMLIKSYISAAREYCEDISNRTYITATKKLILDELKFPIEIPNPPLKSVEKIEFQKKDGTLIEWDAENYVVDTTGDFGWVRKAENATMPNLEVAETNPYQITFVAGHATQNEVPAKYKNAIKLLVTHWYENRVPVAVGTISNKIQFTVDALLSGDRVMPV